jgi:hypothetical protein
VLLLGQPTLQHMIQHLLICEPLLAQAINNITTFSNHLKIHLIQTALLVFKDNVLVKEAEQKKDAVVIGLKS